MAQLITVLLVNEQFHLIKEIDFNFATVMEFFWQKKEEERRNYRVLEMIDEYDITILNSRQIDLLIDDLTLFSKELLDKDFQQELNKFINTLKSNNKIHLFFKFDGD